MITWLSSFATEKFDKISASVFFSGATTSRNPATLCNLHQRIAVLANWVLDSSPVSFFR